MLDSPLCYGRCFFLLNVFQIIILSRLDCKLSGTGTDYSGKLAKTRSGRVCRNYTVCRNPNKNIGGPWCETDDPFVGRDFCMVRDCEWHSNYFYFL